MTTILSPDPLALQLDLPDPDKDDISSIEFLERLQEAWFICEKFDLHTDIWRGKILRVVRDKEKRGGEGRGAGFLQWLREMDISKTRGYALIQLAESADELILEGTLDEKSVNNFSRRSFIETAQSSPEVQQMVVEAANKGNEITRKEVRRLADEFTSATSLCLPEEIRQRTQDNLLPPKIVAPLAKELSKLPDDIQDDLRSVLKDTPDIQSIKEITSTARFIGKTNDASLALRALQRKELNVEQATKEAQRIGALSLLVDAFSQAKNIEASVLRFHTSWRKLNDLHDRLWVESGSSTPYLRDVLKALQTLSGSTMRVSLGELYGGKKIRLQVVEEDADKIEPPDVIELA
ncbi:MULTISPECIES: hypothetical protein [unclassified Prochlorococcus]|uniref:hypothetical protein n=1 Tax=unclassified Prochlorococcus TaxID=2627481 RepID=UPI000533A31E|nr:MULTISPECIES: hypothetical protein [unclassified Prochlorococcus]KGG16587.1 hypothetical protein EV06_0429 [Prochlorococcus sp. MIT 0602]KGG16938.1 hypothetical protein EV07_0365 [Prochlorococcus sp. MIT 0603]